jgi:hypothetical protein
MARRRASSGREPVPAYQMLGLQLDVKPDLLVHPHFGSPTREQAQSDTRSIRPFHRR